MVAITEAEVSVEKALVCVVDECDTLYIYSVRGIAIVATKNPIDPELVRRVYNRISGGFYSFVNYSIEDMIYLFYSSDIINKIVETLRRVNSPHEDKALKFLGSLFDVWNLIFYILRARLSFEDFSLRRKHLVIIDEKTNMLLPVVAFKHDGTYTSLLPIDASFDEIKTILLKETINKLVKTILSREIYEETSEEVIEVLYNMISEQLPTHLANYLSELIDVYEYIDSYIDETKEEFYREEEELYELIFEKTLEKYKEYELKLTPDEKIMRKINEGYNLEAMGRKIAYDLAAGDQMAINQVRKWVNMVKEWLKKNVDPMFKKFIRSGGVISEYMVKLNELLNEVRESAREGVLYPRIPELLRELDGLAREMGLAGVMWGEVRDLSSAVNSATASFHRVLELIEKSYNPEYMILSNRPEAADYVRAFWTAVKEMYLKDMIDEADSGVQYITVTNKEIVMRLGSSEGHACHIDLEKGILEYYDSDYEVVDEIEALIKRYLGDDVYETRYKGGILKVRFKPTHENVLKLVALMPLVISMDIRLNNISSDAEKEVKDFIATRVKEIGDFLIDKMVNNFNDPQIRNLFNVMASVYLYYNYTSDVRYDILFDNVVEVAYEVLKTHPRDIAMRADENLEKLEALINKKPSILRTYYLSIGGSTYTAYKEEILNKLKRKENKQELLSLVG